MARKESIWFHIGHAIERATHPGPGRARSVVGLAKRVSGDKAPTRRSRPGAVASGDDLMAAGIAMVVDRVIGSWGKRSDPGFTRIVRAGAAGAAAALLVDLVRPLLEGEAELPALDGDTADRMIAGFGQGLLYGAVVEPRLPGPALLKGAIYGSVEYAVHPIGGLSGLLGSHTPHRKLPLLSGVFDDLDGGDREFLEHLTFGVALALIHGTMPSSSGMPDDEE